MRDQDWKKDVPWYHAARDAGGPAVAVVILDPAGLDFIIENLPRDDRFTEELIKFREEAMRYLWRLQ
jgi:hypothetical protein